MPEPADRLRARIRSLQVRRRWLESNLLQPQQMIAAALLERFLGSGSRRRRSPAYYLSRSHQGRSQQSYVKRAEVAAVRGQCEAYHAFRENLKQWRRLSRELETLWRRLLETQASQNIFGCLCSISLDIPASLL